MCFRFSPPLGLPLPLSLILVRAGKKKWERRGLPRFSSPPPRGVRRDGSFSLSIKAGRKREGGSAQHVAHFPPTNQPTLPIPTMFLSFPSLPPSFPYRPWWVGWGGWRMALSPKTLFSPPPPPQIPFRYTKSCGAPAKKDGRGEKISRHAKSGRMWRMRDEPRASGGKGGGGTCTYARSWRVHRSISHITPHALGILRKIFFLLCALYLLFHGLLAAAEDVSPLLVPFVVLVLGLIILMPEMEKKNTMFTSFQGRPRKDKIDPISFASREACWIFFSSSATLVRNARCNFLSFCSHSPGVTSGCCANEGGSECFPSGGAKHFF